MARLIYTNDPVKQISEHMEKIKCYDDYRCGLHRGMEISKSYIKNGPTVDAVEVVRCRDCAVPHNKYTGCPKLNGLVTTPDFYCPFGKRKDGDGNG